MTDQELNRLINEFAELQNGNSIKLSALQEILKQKDERIKQATEKADRIPELEKEISRLRRGEE